MRGVVAGARRFVILTAAVAGLGVGGLIAVPVGAAHAAVARAAVTAGYALPSNVTRECPAPTAGTFGCMALVRTDVTSDPSSPAGYGPMELQSAYNLAAAAASDGSGVTVAVVDAYADPNAITDFNTYRQDYGLPGCDATTEAGCLTVMAEEGYSPAPNAAWAAQESMDVDMIAAVCPKCHVLLAEAASDSQADLEATANEAVSKGAKFESLGFGMPESAGDTYQGLQFEPFGETGVAVTAAAGDGGYGVQYPASSQFVTAVGGTTLTRDMNNPRTWSESVWAGTGAGCSATQFKPSWQADTGCANRTQNDVAAVADPQTGVAFYDTYDSAGWGEGGGTNVSSAIIAAVYALAGAPEHYTYAASYPYRDPAALYPVTSGSDGTCTSAYLCAAGAGYSGPAGLGTPDGTAAFAAPSGNVVTLYRDSANPSIPLQYPYGIDGMVALDSQIHPSMVASVTGQPPGMTVSPCGPGVHGCTLDLDGAPTQVGTFTAHVTVKDDTGASATVSVPVTVDDVIPNFGAPLQSVTIGKSVSLPVTATSTAGDALDFAVNGLPPGLSYAKTGPDQITFTGTSTTPGTYTTTITATNPLGGSGTGQVQWIVHGTIAVKSQANLTSDVGGAAAVTIGAIDSVKGAQLSYFATGLPPGVYQGTVPDTNVISGWPTKAGTYHVTLTVTDNYRASTSESFTWTVKDSASSEAYGPIRLDLGGKCLDDGTGVRIWNCNGTGSQNWTIAQDGTIRGRGECLTESGTNYGSRVVLAECTDAASQRWQAQEEPAQSLDGWAGPALVNAASGHCLGDPGGNRNGVYVEMLACNVGASKTWTTPAGPIENGIPGMCLADPGNATANGTPVVLWQCNGWHEEDWTFEPDGTVRINGKCLYVNPNSRANGDYARLETCNAENEGEQWADYGANPFGGTVYNPWNGNNLGTAGSSAANGSPVGTYIGGPQLSLTWRPL
jgi:ricin-type beta-trefoil lectin protein/putative Ig domain-containing protein